MHFQLFKLKWLTVAAAAIALVACGGGNDERSGGNSSSASVSKIKIVGDSLADSGTFGNKATVQSAKREETLIWVDHVAKTLSLTICPRYISDSGFRVSLNTSPNAVNCTNYAVSGGEINPVNRTQTPYSIVRQLEDLSQSSSYLAGDLLIVNGGGNDIMQLMKTLSGSTMRDYRNQLLTLLTPTQTAELARIDDSDTEGLLRMGNAYMSNLAGVLADALQTHALDRGASHVLVLNLPDVTRTPLAQELYVLINQRTGNATLSNTLNVAAKRWVTSFNTQLQTHFSNQDNRVGIVDFYHHFNVWFGQPNQYGFTNVQDAACSVIAVANLANCVANTLSATAPPAGAIGGSNWWTTYLFADGFHGTPKTNQMMGDVVRQTLVNKGWLRLGSTEIKY